MISQILRELRTAKKLTYKKVYEKTGISDSRLHRFETGRISTLSIDELVSLSNLYDISLEDLLFRAGYIKLNYAVFNNAEILSKDEQQHIQNEIDFIVKLKDGTK